MIRVCATRCVGRIGLSDGRRQVAQAQALTALAAGGIMSVATAVKDVAEVYDLGDVEAELGKIKKGRGGCRRVGRRAGDGRSQGASRGEAGISTELAWFAKLTWLRRKDGNAPSKLRRASPTLMEAFLGTLAFSGSAAPTVAPGRKRFPSPAEPKIRRPRCQL